MNTERLIHSLSPEDYAALMDAAKLRATQLRGEAMRDFWSAVARGLRSVWRAPRRDVPNSRAGLQQKAGTCLR